ncbi:hypothetical protein [Zhongshania sp.]|uniref:hypothetical protein n=1 Tax=Zhongshania sp. TaxID=1971902 RepID=UPI003568CD8E
MQIIEAFKAVDGTIFEDYDKAKRHDLDCIGELIDGLLLVAVQATGGNVTRIDQHRMALKLLESRADILPDIQKLARYIEEQ